MAVIFFILTLLIILLLIVLLNEGMCMVGLIYDLIKNKCYGVSDLSNAKQFYL